MHFDRKNWKGSYKALILLEHLLTHGPLRIADEFKDNTYVIKEIESFHYIDEKGFAFWHDLFLFFLKFFLYIIGKI